MSCKKKIKTQDDLICGVLARLNEDFNLGVDISEENRPRLISQSRGSMIRLLEKEGDLNV